MPSTAPRTVPTPPTALIGRDAEIESLRELLVAAQTRLVTLVGPPGVGKTALALHLAAHLGPAYPDGALFVPLDATEDAALVPAALARRLALREEGGRTPAETVIAALAERRALLMLDNFEQVIDAAGFVADLLAGCPQLAVLVTSRTPLRLRAEQQVPVEPLAVGGNREQGTGNRDEGNGEGSGAERGMTAGEIAPAVALFVQRAAAVRPAFALTVANVGDVAAICTALDGLPLAIELAAARVSILSPAEIVARLRDRFALLVDGYRDLPERHRTLYAAVDWSYALLAPEDRALLRQLSVFAGGCTVEAVEAVAVIGVEPPPPALRGLASLVEKQLLRRDEHEGGGTRFTMLESIRAFALEQLGRAGELATLQAYHAAYCLQLAETAATAFGGPEQAAYAEQLRADYGNLRAALHWSLGGGDRGLGVRLAVALGWYWRTQGSWAEGREWLDQALARPGGVPAALRVRLLWEAAMLAVARGDLAGGAVVGAESLALAGEVGDERGAGRALLALGDAAHFQGEIDAAWSRHEQSLAAAERAGDQWTAAQALGRLMMATKVRAGDLGEAQRLGERGLAVARAAGDEATAAWLLFRLGWLAMAREEIEPARRRFQESRHASERVDDRLGVPDALMGLGELARMEGDYALAETLYADALRRYRQTGDQREITIAAVINLGFVALDRGALGEARARFTEGLAHVRARGHWAWSTLLLTGLGGVAAAAGEGERALRALGAADALRPAGSVLDAADQREYDRYLALARAGLDEAGQARAWRAGQALSLDDALADAQATSPGTPPEPTPVGTGAAPEPVAAAFAPLPDDLTARELDVLRLLADGMSNMEIAAQLVVSRRTVENHLGSIYDKTGARGRAAAAAYAHRKGIGSSE